jgi:TonB-dependent starch-binding outer membrane protein SusC
MRKFLLFMSALLVFTGVFAQEKTITGKITDARDGTPMIGVTVSGKGSSAYTQSGPEGSFSITLPSSVTVLVFSSVGFPNTEVNISNRSVINVQLSTDGKSLDEVVVVAYGTQRKAEVTGASSKVLSKDIANIPRTSVDQILQGKVAGLQSVTPSGQPGSIQQLRLRGIGSITAGSAPLWVIDGVPVNTGDFTRNTTTSNALAGLNPNDIEDITVLKDASATSIYGSRAANGVILVTTKKGKSGKSRIKLDTEIGFTDLMALPKESKPLNAAQWLELTREGLENLGVLTEAEINDAMESWGEGSGIDNDWIDIVSRRGDQQQANLSASGGNDKTTYYISGGYFKQEAPIIGSGFKRYSGAFNLQNKFNDRITVSTNLNIASVTQNTPTSGGSFGNPLIQARFLRPTQNPYNPDGTLNISRATPMDFPNTYNPLYTVQHDRKQLNNVKILGNIAGEYKILDNLKFTTRYGVDYITLEEDQYDNPFHGDGRTTNGSLFFNYTKVFNWVWTNQLDYRQYIFGRDNDIYIDAKLGYESQRSKQINRDSQVDGFPPTAALTIPDVASTPVTIEGANLNYTFQSIFSNLVLNYKNKYVITGSFRRDGSSRFGINNRYGNFWSVGAAWNIDQEAFMQPVTFVSGAKLRASYGVNGNGDLDNYAWRPLFKYGANYGGMPGGSFDQIGNIDLTWELNKPFNVGLDLSLFNQRISLIVDYYTRTTSDLLLERPLPPSTGFEEIIQNVGAMKNSGIEVELNATAVRTRDFSWNIGFNIARNKNRITSLPEGDYVDGSFYRSVGKDYQTFYVRQWAGVNPDNGNPLWYVDETKTTTTSSYGQAQRVPLYSATPKMFGSLNNTFTFQNFGLDFQLYYNFGNHVRDQWASYMLDGVDPNQNKYAMNLRRWQKPGDITDVPRYQYQLINNSSSFSTRLLFKGDFIRLRNITLSYRLPKTVLDKLKLGSALFYVRGFNLWTKTFDDRLTVDPETGITSIDNLTIPISKTITVGLNLEF